MTHSEAFGMVYRMIEYFGVLVGKYRMLSYSLEWNNLKIN